MHAMTSALNPRVAFHELGSPLGKPHSKGTCLLSQGRGADGGIRSSGAQGALRCAPVRIRVRSGLTTLAFPRSNLLRAVKSSLHNGMPTTSGLVILIVTSRCWCGHRSQWPSIEHANAVGPIGKLDDEELVELYEYLTQPHGSQSARQ